MSENVSPFEDAFPEALASRRRARAERAKREKRTHLSDKQRSRTAMRTAQLCFRCAPSFKDRVHAMQALLYPDTRASIADVLEDALALLEREKGVVPQ